MPPIMRRLLFAVVALLALSLPARAKPPTDLATTPPMGWNSWNWHGKPAINETVVRETIDAMVSSGLRDAGYTYVVVDGGWRDTKLLPNGELVSHPLRFPNGMKRLADYAHSQGLKFGLHTTPGTRDCGGDPVGGFGHEEVHVRQFVEWGIDFIKLDRCKMEPAWTEAQVETVYRKWSDLLARCGRDIVLSINAHFYHDWHSSVAHMARTTEDIRARIHKGGATFDDTGKSHTGYRYLSVMEIADQNNASAAFAGHGHWNDAEMLVTGEQGLNEEEQKVHFALWCIMSAPLILGNDPRHMTEAEKAVVLNREAIAVNQDPTEQGRRVVQEGKREVWIKRLTGNRAAVLLLNRDAVETHSLTFDPNLAGIAADYTARDVYAGKDLGRQRGPLAKSLAPHSGWFLVVASESAQP